MLSAVEPSSSTLTFAAPDPVPPASARSVSSTLTDSRSSPVSLPTRRLAPRLPVIRVPATSRSISAVGPSPFATAEPKVMPLLAQPESSPPRIVVSIVLPAPPLAASRQSALLPGIRTVLPVPDPAKPRESVAVTSSRLSRISELVPSASCSSTSPVASVKLERATLTLEREPSPIVTYSRPLPEKPPSPFGLV